VGKCTIIVINHHVLIATEVDRTYTSVDPAKAALPDLAPQPQAPQLRIEVLQQLRQDGQR
jgi:hypothetical protein